MPPDEWTGAGLRRPMDLGRPRAVYRRPRRRTVARRRAWALRWAVVVLVLAAAAACGDWPPVG